MRGKNSLIIGMSILFIGLSLPQTANTQTLNKSDQAIELQIVRSINAYISDVEKNKNFRIIALQSFLKPFVTDWQYATTHNFTRQKLYSNPKAFLRLPAAIALKNVQSELLTLGLNIKLFDAYRPYHVTQKMWEIIPDERYAANPARGSGHNRGIAVDVSIVNAKTGVELEMPTTFDDFSEKAHHDYKDLPDNMLKNRALLRSVMEKNGFKALSTEWWHYYLPDSKNYPLMDLSFRQMNKAAKLNVKEENN